MNRFLHVSFRLILLSAALIACSSPDDPGTPPATSVCSVTPGAQDKDGDCLSDASEIAGWFINVEDARGTIYTREVFSHPDKADTDNDGLCDADELNRWGSIPSDAEAVGNLFGQGNTLVVA